MRILIVDDEAGIRQVCERALRRAGHEVGSCGSGEDALGRLSEAWDLVVSDVRLNGEVDGHEVIRRARAAGAGGVALMTSYPSLESAVSAMKDGACDYLLKPFPLDALVALASRSPAPTVIEPRRSLEATILFADVRGFTSFSETAAPELVASRLDELLACFIAAVHAEGGAVNKLIGDGAMAVFGAPAAHAEPEAAAVRAALRVREEVARLGDLRFGFGINTGLVAAGRLGSSGDAEYGVIGSAVNVAARLQERAGPGCILAGAATLARLDGRFRLGAARDLVLKGLKDPVRATEVLGLSVV